MQPVKNLKVGCGKFLFGKGALKSLVTEIKRLGGKPTLVGGVLTLPMIRKRIEIELQQSGIAPKWITHKEACTKEWAKKYACQAQSEGRSVLVGIGGGKNLDLVKCASVYGGFPVITVPTSIATCAACSAFCVMYSEDGKPAGPVHMEREIDVVIADSEIIAQAPVRLLASGIFDSISKLPEVIHDVAIDSYRDCSLQKYISAVNAKGIYEFLMGECVSACRKKGCYSRFDELVLTNLLHTGVVSGFSAGLGQQALAHGFYNYVRQEFTMEGDGSLHGEIVGVGILVQCSYNGMKKEEIKKIRETMLEIGLPVKAEQVGFVNTGESVERMVQFLLCITKTGESQRERVYKAVQEIL